MPSGILKLLNSLKSNNLANEERLTRVSKDKLIKHSYYVTEKLKGFHTIWFLLRLEAFLIIE